VRKISWETLEQTWSGLRAVADQYKSDSREFATLVEACRLLEAEMHEQGYKTKWATLTGGDQDSEINAEGDGQ
jgi:hypothetical protein